jgi:hypothetical protein
VNLQHICWSWDLYNETLLEDKDTSVATIESGWLDLEYDIFLKDKVLPENATRAIFGWLRNSDCPKNEKKIYSHLQIDF